MFKKQLLIALIAGLVLSGSARAGAGMLKATPSETAKEAPKEAPKEAASESPKETAKDTAGDSTKDSAKESAKDLKDKAKDGSKEEKAESTASHKSPVIAGGLAFFPGIAVHGSGHMYAGSWMKGLGLVAIEGAAIGIGYAQISGGADDITKLADGLSKGKFPTDAGGAFTKVGILTVSTMAFLWTWFDDMAGAPIAANEYNKIQDENAQARLQLLPREDGAVLALSASF